MNKIKFPEQKAELEKLLEGSHLSDSDLASRAGIKWDTFRKYLGGYQQCGRQTLIAIRTAAAFEMERMQRASGAPLPEGSLHEEAVQYAAKLLRLPAEKRELAKTLIDQLSGQPNSTGDQVASKLLRRAVGDAKKSRS